MKRKLVDDIYLDSKPKEFTLGTIREGIKKSEYPGSKAQRVVSYIISRDGLGDSDIKKIRKSVKELGNIKHDNIAIPEKVIITSSKIYFVFNLDKDKEKPFIEAYKERMIRVPRFFEKLAESVTYLKENSVCPVEIIPETLRFDRQGNFQLHDLNCDFLLQKKFFTNRIQERKTKEVLKFHAPEIINKSEVKEIDPEKSLVYSMGVLFDGCADQRTKIDDPEILTKKCHNFINQMKDKVADERPSLDEVLEYSWNKTKQKSVSFDNETKEKTFKSDEALDKRKWKEKIAIKSGPFTEEEVEKLKHAMCRYCYEKGWGEAGINKLITAYRDKDVRGAWTKISECLPDRRVSSCHQLIRTKFHPGNYKGTWSKEDEEELAELVKEKGRKWQEISEILERTPMNVRDKWRSMGEENHDKRKGGAWTPEEIIKLFRIVEKRTGVKVLEKTAEEWVKEEQQKGEVEEEVSVKDRISKRRKDAFTKLFESNLCDFIDYEEAKKLNYMSLEWTKIAKEMETKSKDDCRNLWFNQIYNTIASGLDFNEDEDEVLIRSITEQDPTTDAEINYEDIDNGRSAKDNEIRWKQLSRAASSRANKSTNELVKMVKKYKSELGKTKKDKYKKNDKNQNKIDEILTLYKTEFKDE